MGDKSKIEWTDITWNFITGCSKISDGCLNCYIERTPPFRMAHRKFDKPGIGGKAGVKLHSERLHWPLTKWRKPERIFVNSLADVFHEDVPDQFIAEAFAVMAIARHHTFQMLTKRHARMRSLLAGAEANGFLDAIAAALFARGVTAAFEWPLPNVHLGVSVESQQWADIRIPALLSTPAAVRWISAEPLLGPVNLSRFLHWRPVGANLMHEPLSPPAAEACRLPPLHWIVVGGESGPGARPMHPQWARGLRDQCAEAGIPMLFKQWGEWGPAPWSVKVCDPAIGWQGTDEELAEAKKGSEARAATHSYAVWADQYGHEPVRAGHKPWSLERCSLDETQQAPMRKWGKKAAGRELDGRTHDEYPQMAEVQS